MSDTDRDPSIDSAAIAISNLLGGRDRDAGVEPVAPVAPPEPEPAPVETDGDETPEHIPDEASLEGDAPVEEAPQGDNPPQAVMPPPVAPFVAPQAVQPAPTEPPAASSNILAQLNAYIPQLQVQIAAQFPEIRNDDDLIRVANEDPARALQFTLQRDRLNKATTLHSQAMAEQQANWRRSEGAKLAAIPEFSDPVKGLALENSVRAYAAKIGYAPEVIANASALDIVNMHKIMLHDQRAAKDAADAKAQAEALKQAKVKAADAPPVQKPGSQRTVEKADKFKDSRDRLRKTGSVDDAAKVFSLLG